MRVNQITETKVIHYHTCPFDAKSPTGLCMSCSKKPCNAVSYIDGFLILGIPFVLSRRLGDFIFFYAYLGFACSHLLRTKRFVVR